MMAKPMKTLELHYPMIQFLIKTNSARIKKNSRVAMTLAARIKFMSRAYETLTLLFQEPLTSASSVARRDRLVVRTLRCGPSNPGSNPGPGITFLFPLFKCFFFHYLLSLETDQLWSKERYLAL